MIDLKGKSVLVKTQEETLSYSEINVTDIKKDAH